MEITKVRFYDLGDGSSSYLGKCSVVLSGVLVLHDIKLFDGQKGRYIVMPRKSGVAEDGGVGDVFHPVKSSFFAYMSSVILDAYSEKF